MDSLITVFSFELFPGRTLTLLPYHKVENTKQVFDALKSGDLPPCGFINPAFFLSPLQLHITANKTLFYQQNSTMITKEIHTEFLHNLSAQRNITTSLKEFGIANHRPQFIVFLFDAGQDAIEKLQNIIKGTLISLNSEEMNALCDDKAIIKHYKIEPQELELGRLADAVINRIAIRDM